MVRNIVRLEGLAVFLVALFLYDLIQGNWWIFLALILVPDISMVGYLVSKKLGAVTYNLVHNYILGIAATLLGFRLNIEWLFIGGVILLAHVGMDRLLGFGLKYPKDFKETHIQKL
jgi:hypothetical protein